MRLPISLQNRRYIDWNFLVRGLVEVWEIACLLGLERPLELALERDSDGSLTEHLARIGNDLSRLASARALFAYLSGLETGVPSLSCGDTAYGEGIPAPLLPDGEVVPLRLRYLFTGLIQALAPEEWQPRLAMSPVETMV